MYTQWGFAVSKKNHATLYNKYNFQILSFNLTIMKYVFTWTRTDVYIIMIVMGVGLKIACTGHSTAAP